MKKLFTTLGFVAWGLSAFARLGGMKHEWSGMFNTGKHMNVTSISSDTQNNVLLALSVDGKVDFDLSSQVTERTFSVVGGAIVSYAPDKTFRWVKAFTGSENHIRNISVTASGEILVTGVFKTAFYVNGAGTTATFSGSADQWNAYVLKLDANGNYIGGISFNVGNTVDLTNVESDASGNIYVSGYTQANLDLDPSAETKSVLKNNANATGFVAKYTTNFEYVWGMYHGASATANTYNRSMTSNDDFLFVAGDYTSGGNIIFRNVGNTTAIKTITAATKTTGYVAIIQKSDGALVDVELLSSGEKVEVYDIEYSTVDNSVIVTGEYIKSLAIDNEAITGNTIYVRGFFSKLMVSNGTDKLVHNWTQTLIHNAETQHQIYTRDASVGANGDIFVGTTGRSGLSSELYQNGKKGVLTVNASVGGNSDGMSAYFDKNGRLVYSGYYGNLGNSYITCTNITASGKAVMGGWFRGITDFDVETGVVNHNGGDFNSIGFAQYDMSPATTRIYVNPTAPANGDGRSWASAMNSTFTALGVATNGDTLLIAKGTQTYSNGLAIDKNVTLLGGFDGTSPIRNVKENETIFDGNNLAVHLLNITAPNVTLDGIIIQKAKQISSNANLNDGAGILYNVSNTNGVFNIRNCIIRDNIGFTEGAGFKVNVDGTGNYVVNVENTRIHNNKSRYAPSWLISTKGSAKLTANFINTLVDNNSTVDYPSGWTGFKASGGGMISGFNSSESTLNLLNCTFGKAIYLGTNTTTGNALICVSEANPSTAKVHVNVQNTILQGNPSLGRWANTAYTSMTNLKIRNVMSEDVPTANYAEGTFSMLNHTLITEDDFIFNNPGAGDYTLLSGSAAIDAGDTTGISMFIRNQDLGGKERIANGKIDLGAFEANSPILETISIEKGTIVLYPNPVATTLTIEATDLVNVQITNTNGQVVLSSTENTIDVSNLAIGLYILHIQTENGVYNAKVIKE